MRIEEEVYISPTDTFLDIKWDNPDNLITIFSNRIYGFYFEPAETLNNEGHAFASGLICLSLIDLFSNLDSHNGSNNKVGFNFKYWLRTNIQDFDKPDPSRIYHNLAHRFYKEFRNSLIHECRIRNAGQFSYDFDSIIYFIRNSGRHIMIVNPKLLLYHLKEAFDDYLTTVSKNKTEFQKFKRMLKSNFNIDFECAEWGIE